MTDSAVTSSAVPAERAGKRERLVAAACRVLHEQGVERTTLADIAQAAGVPVGNVYYYFKTKDQLVEAALRAHGENLRASLAILDRRRSPQARLKGLIREWTSQRELVARYGCPFGTLACELDKRTDGLDRTAADTLAILTGWAEQQFRDMGRTDARDLGVSLVASYQGIAVLANAFRDPDLMVKESRRLERWIDSLSQMSNSLLIHVLALLRITDGCLSHHPADDLMAAGIR